MKDDTLHLSQIRDSIRKIELYVDGITREQYLTDEKTQSALLLQLILIGEISKKISDHTKSSIDVPWKRIIGFRDRAIHNYFEMDLEVVWATVTDDIPVFKMHLEKFVL